jgi:hypothetical protein
VNEVSSGSPEPFMSKNSLPLSGGTGVEVAVGLGDSVAVGISVVVAVVVGADGAQAERALTNSAVNKRFANFFMAVLQ